MQIIFFGSQIFATGARMVKVWIFYVQLFFSWPKCMAFSGFGAFCWVVAVFFADHGLPPCICFQLALCLLALNVHTILPSKRNLLLCNDLVQVRDSNCPGAATALFLLCHDVTRRRAVVENTGDGGSHDCEKVSRPVLCSVVLTCCNSATTS